MYEEISTRKPRGVRARYKINENSKKIFVRSKRTTARAFYFSRITTAYNNTVRYTGCFTLPSSPTKSETVLCKCINLYRRYLYCTAIINNILLEYAIIILYAV